MQFIFYGTPDALKNAIMTKANALRRDIVVYHGQPDTLQIGFLRLGHSGGRFFCEDDRRKQQRYLRSIFLTYSIAAAAWSIPRRFFAGVNISKSGG